MRVRLGYDHEFALLTGNIDSDSVKTTENGGRASRASAANITSSPTQALFWSSPLFAVPTFRIRGAVVG